MRKSRSTISSEVIILLNKPDPLCVSAIKGAKYPILVTAKSSTNIVKKALYIILIIVFV